MEFLKFAIVSNWAQYRTVLSKIIFHGLSVLLRPMISMLLAYLVIRSVGLNLWGSFIAVQIVVSLAAMVSSWGSKEYLMRKFSLDLINLKKYWLESLLNRSVILLPLFLALFLLQKEFVLITAIWLIGLYLYQSFEPVAIIKQDFKVWLLVELVGGIALIFLTLFIIDDLKLNGLISVVVMSVYLKTISLSVYYRKLFKSSPDWFQDFRPSSYLSESIYFLVLAGTAFLQSRIDLYIIDWKFDAETLGLYQVLRSVLIYSQAIAGFLVVPFTKRLYKMPVDNTYELSMRMLMLGVLLSPFVYLLLYAIFNYILAVDLPMEVGFWSILIVVPSFFFIPIIYQLFKNKLERRVLQGNLISLSINAILSLSLVGAWGYLGALIGTAISQVFLLIYFYFEIVKLKKCP